MQILYMAGLVPLLAMNYLALRAVKRSFGLLLTPVLGWLIGLTVFLVVPISVITLNGGYRMPPFYDIREAWGGVDLTGTKFALPFAFIWASLILSFAIVITNAGAYSFSPACSRRASEESIRSILKTTSMLAAVVWGLSIALAGGVEAYFTSHWLYRQEDMVERFGESVLLLGRLSQANFTVFVASAVLYLRYQLERQRLGGWLSILIVFVLLLELVMTGNRIYIALFLLTCLALCWILNRKKILVGFIALAPVIVLAFSLWASIRSNLTQVQEKVPGYLSADLGNRALTTVMDVSEGQNVMQLLHMIRDFGPRFDYLMGITYTKAFTFWVPRGLYPDKPEHYTVTIAKLYSPGSRTSFNTTQLGELYANFGMLSLWFLPAISFGFLKLSQALRLGHASLVLCTVVFLQCIWFARSSFADNFVPLVITLVFVRFFRI